MNTITVGQLRQNPTQMLADVEAGATYTITRHNQEIARVVPVQQIPGLIPAKRTGPSHLADRPRLTLRTAESVEQLLEEMKGDW
ncbi:type II toxin-antitoxin system Phd/YefM family antitoxin [Microbacterium sp.]|uniref:type II toxin-antitoxin system Phd/YefM family antitoxin n=1 Tax=Microbacterium sp. TaxID=51671 RepID=UPI003C7710BA